MGKIGGPASAVLFLALLGGCSTEQSESSGAKGPYRAAPSLATGAEPIALALGDFDADSALDLVVAQHGAASLGLFRGRGDGRFDANGELGVGPEPRSVATGDFDADGAVDIAACSSADDTVSVFLNPGDGAFAAVITLSTGQRPTFVAARDLNQDGRADLLVTNSDGNSISVFLAQSGGGFAPVVELPAGTNPVRATLVDLDLDGAIDVVTATRVVPPTIAVLLGDGTGGFGAPSKYKASNRPGLVFPIAPQAISSGDVDGDGKMDVLVGNRGLDILDGEVWLLKGDGTGVLSEPAEVPGVTVLAPAFIDLVDLDANGTLDVIEADHDPSIAALVAAISGSGYSVCTANNGGKGSFEHGTCLPTGDYPYEAVTGHLDDDDKLDVVTADAGSDKVSVYLARF